MSRFITLVACVTTTLALFHSLTSAGSALANSPMLFDTGMVPVRTTPYDARLSGISAGALGKASGIAQQARGLSILQQVRFVNKGVNRAISYRQDKGDDWASASRIFQTGEGDCEDYAIAKMDMAGVGQMALTNYLTHSVVALIIFVILGWWGLLERHRLYFIVAAIWAVQFVLSPIWMRNFHFGPVEWLLRYLTCGTKPLFRKDVGSPPPAGELPASAAVV